MWLVKATGPFLLNEDVGERKSRGVLGEETWLAIRVKVGVEAEPLVETIAKKTTLENNAFKHLFFNGK